MFIWSLEQNNKQINYFKNVDISYLCFALLCSNQSKGDTFIYIIGLAADCVSLCYGDLLVISPRNRS